MIKVTRTRNRAVPADGMRPARAVARDTAGTSAVEFAFIAPVLMLLALGTVQFGLTLNNYITLTDSVRTASRQLSVSRGGGTPYTDTVNQIYRSSPALARASLTISVSVNGTSCSTDTSCASALAGAQGRPASVAATYPCDLSFMGHDFAPGCTLASQTTERDRMSGIWDLLSRLRHDRRGAVAIMMAAGTILFVGFGAAVVDIGYLFHVRRVLQTSADMAALAGAQDINSGASGQAISTAISYSGVPGNRNAQPGLDIAWQAGIRRCGVSPAPACRAPGRIRQTASSSSNRPTCRCSSPGCSATRRSRCR